MYVYLLVKSPSLVDGLLMFYCDHHRKSADFWQFSYGLTASLDDYVM